MYFHISSSMDGQSDDTLCAPSSPQQQQASSLERELQLQLMEQEQSASTGKRKSPERDVDKSYSSPKSIDPLSLLDDSTKYSYKRQRLETESIRDYPTSLSSNEQSFAPSYPFLHSAPISRPNPTTPPRTPPAPLYAAYPSTPQEEERILREEFYSQQNYINPGPSSNGYTSYATSTSPFLLPPFAAPSQQSPSQYSNGYASICNPPPRSSVSDLYYTSREPCARSQHYSPPTSEPGSPTGGTQEDFIAETKMSKDMKKMTTVLGQIPGLEKIRWQSILQGTRSPDVGERETQRRVKEAETIGARLFGGDIDKLLGSILNQHLDFLVSYVANLKNGKKKHNKLRMQLSKVLQDSA